MPTLLDRLVTNAGAGRPGVRRVLDLLTGGAAHHAVQEAPQGLYIGRRLTNDAAWRAWAASVGLPALDEHLHVTVLYSSVGVALPLAAGAVTVPAERITGIGHLGKDDALVVFFEDETLAARYAEALAAGARTTYSSYRPHMTLFYDTGKTVDPATIPLPGLPIELGPETAGPLAIDVFKAWNGAVEGSPVDAPGVPGVLEYRDVQLFHGTRAHITKFDPDHGATRGVSFAHQRQEAERYAREGSSPLGAVTGKREDDAPRVYEVRGRIRVLDASAPWSAHQALAVAAVLANGYQDFAAQIEHELQTDGAVDGWTMIQRLEAHDATHGTQWDRVADVHGYVRVDHSAGIEYKVYRPEPLEIVATHPVPEHEPHALHEVEPGVVNATREPRDPAAPSLLAQLIQKARRAWDESQVNRVRDGKGGKKDGTFAPKAHGAGGALTAEQSVLDARADRAFAAWETGARRMAATESMLVMFADGNMDELVGTKSAVRIPPGVRQRLRGARASHNHPNGSCVLSAADIITANDTRMSELRMVTRASLPVGRRGVMTRRDVTVSLRLNGKHSSEEQLERALFRELKKEGVLWVESYVMPSARSPLGRAMARTSKQGAERLVDEAMERAWKRLAKKMGWTYTRTDSAPSDRVGKAAEAGAPVARGDDFVLDDTMGPREALDYLRRWKAANDPQRVAKARRAFDAAKHPRWDDGPGGQPDGRFKPKDGVSGGTGSAARAWQGRPKPLKRALSKREVGQLGEQVALAFLRSRGAKDAGSMNLRTENFPVDLLHDHRVVEVKTGLVSNGRSAQQWRMTIGEPYESEKLMLARMSAEDKAAWNRQKMRAIRQRKEAVVRTYSRKLGRKVRGTTIAIILDPDRQVADIFEFDGFHERIGWTSELAKKGYRTTVKYGKATRKEATVLHQILALISPGDAHE